MALQLYEVIGPLENKILPGGVALSEYLDLSRRGILYRGEDNQFYVRDNQHLPSYIKPRLDTKKPAPDQQYFQVTLGMKQSTIPGKVSISIV